MPHSIPLDAPAPSGWRIRIAAAAVAALLAACKPAVESAQAMGGPQESPDVAVKVARVVERNTAPEATHLARVEAAERVEIRPRVGGQVIAVLFREGELVAAGQPLFRLDPRPFDIAVEKAEAELKLAAAREQLTRQSHERAMTLIVEDAIASEEKEQRESAHRQAVAQVAYAKAALEAALLDREFATVRAPIAGMVGRALVTQGHQVVGGPAQAPMAVLSSSALHVHLDVPHDDGALNAGNGFALPIKARLQSVGHERAVGSATLDYRDPEVQSQTGSIRLRGRIESGGRTLTAGQHVLAILPQQNTQQTLWIPDKAVGTDQGRHYALVVGPEQTVEYRALELGITKGLDRQVLSGLKAGESVVAEGLMRVRPGVKVQPTPVSNTDPAAGQVSALDSKSSRSGG